MATRGDVEQTEPVERMQVEEASMCSRLADAVSSWRRMKVRTVECGMGYGEERE